MSFCLANGVGVVRGELVLPRIGVWHAELELEDDSVQDGPVKLAWWGQQLTLNGTVRYGGANDGASALHVVGGSGGLTAAVKPKAYQNVQRSVVVADLLKLANEQLSPRADQTWLSTQLPFWTLVQGTVGRALSLLVEMQDGISWRVLADGKFWFGPEAWGAVDVDFEELSRSPRGYHMDISTETPAIMPGCTFLGQRVSTVTYQLEERDMRVRLDFEAPDASGGASADGDRTLGPFRSLVRAAVARVDHYALFSAVVNTDNGDETCDLTPEDTRLPSMSKVPKLYGLPGIKTTLRQGAKVLVCFQNGDPSRPAIVLFGTGSASELDINPSLIKAQGGGTPVAKEGSATVGHTHTITGTAGPYPIIATIGTATDSIASGQGSANVKVP